jgi:hypothetical protein
MGPIFSESGFVAVWGLEVRMRITNGSPYYYSTTVLLDGEEIVDFLWADEEAGEVMTVAYGPRDAHGFRKETRKLLKGKVKIVSQ